MAGIVSGTVVHTFAAAFGLSAILAASATAFVVVKLAGALYLIYLGITMAFRRTEETRPAEFARESDWAIYRAGLLTNVLNPKVALFFMAFLLLGAIFIFNGTLWCLVLVAGASAMSRRLRARPSAGGWLRRLTGVTFVGLGVRLATAKS